MTRGKRGESDDVSRRAMAAAAAGDPEGMVRVLLEQGALAGLKRQMIALFDKLDADDVEDVIASSIDAIYGRTRDRGPPDNLLGYLYKSVRNACMKRNAERAVEVGFDGATHERTHRRFWNSATPEEAEASRRLRAAARSEARRLLERTRGTRMFDVGKYIFDAFEDGAEDVTDEEIARAFGLTQGNVRVLKHRLRERLKDLATQEGIELTLAADAVGLGSDGEERDDG